MDEKNRLQFSLLFIRLTVFLVMFMWTLDKFINPGNAVMRFEHFYFIGGLENIAVYVIGALEMAVLLMFLVGYRKLYSYGAVMLFHSVSTLAPFAQYLAPFEDHNMLFFAAWPMLAACVTLFLMREQDTVYTLT